MSPRLLTVLVIARSIASHVTHPKLIKTKARPRSSRAHDTPNRMSRDVRSVLEGVRRGGSSSSAGPVHERKRRVRSEWREARGSARIDPRNPGTHERNVCTRERTTTPPTRTHSALRGYAFRDQCPRRRPRRGSIPECLSPSSVCDPAYMHTFPSHIYGYFAPPTR